MNDLIGSLVMSTNGRDGGNIYLVYNVEGSYVYLVDGDYRKIKNQKKKNIKHIKKLDIQSLSIKEKIEQNLKVFDSEIYSFIKNCKK